MSDSITILGIPGSLRKAAWSKAVLRATQSVAPAGVTIDSFEIEGIPPFNQDEEKNPAPRVVELKRAVRAADAVLFVTPEYNYGIPGVLKNAIDAASRPYGDSAWKHKPVNVISNAPRALGGIKAALQLRQSFSFLEMYPYVGPEIVITFVADKVTPEGAFKDDATKKFVTDMLVGFEKWIRRFRPVSAAGEALGGGD
ncbi:MAG TPA: NAD(P)H-dependent oxidoreductase [Gemmatimonadales bacterium]|jgi:chromate reductase